MKPAGRRTWLVGDRFSMNRWNERWPEPLVFEITARTPTAILFWAPAWDSKPRGRRMTYQAFYRRVARRELVRVIA